MTRMPPKWGPLRRYFLIGIAGVIGLTASFALISWIGQSANWSPTTYLIAVAIIAPNGDPHTDIAC
jgi:hypothetical protein